MSPTGDASRRSPVQVAVWSGPTTTKQPTPPTRNIVGSSTRSQSWPNVMTKSGIGVLAREELIEAEEEEGR